MAATTFDALEYFEKLKAAGVPEEQARIQANAFRDFSAIQEERAKNELATKSDLRETELRLQKEIQEVKYSLLKWQIGGWIALAAIMAKGFNWIGF